MGVDRLLSTQTEYLFSQAPGIQTVWDELSSHLVIWVQTWAVKLTYSKNPKCSHISVPCGILSRGMYNLGHLPARALLKGKVTGHCSLMSSPPQLPPCSAAQHTARRNSSVQQPLDLKFKKSSSPQNEMNASNQPCPRLINLNDEIARNPVRFRLNNNAWIPSFLAGGHCAFSPDHRELHLQLNHSHTTLLYLLKVFLFFL